MLVGKQELIELDSQSTSLPKLRAPTTDVLSQFRDLYNVNMAKTRRHVSLSFAPAKPWSQRSPAEFLPVFLPKEGDAPCRKCWHWAAFAVTIFLVMALGVFASAKFYEITEQVVLYARSYRKLEALPMRKHDWLETEQNQIYFNLTTENPEGRNPQTGQVYGRAQGTEGRPAVAKVFPRPR